MILNELHGTTGEYVGWTGNNMIKVAYNLTVILTFPWVKIQTLENIQQRISFFADVSNQSKIREKYRLRSGVYSIMTILVKKNSICRGRRRLIADN